MLEVNDFNAVRISLASPEQIRSWSYGEVTKPETINYRTLKPEKDGLFCEKIFGPTKDWECYCGKYKRVRYKGIVCDKCGVEVARAKVRRERMGHIELAAPVSHIWFVKGTPSRIGLLLDKSPRELERVLYFASFIVTSVDDQAKARALEGLEHEAEKRRARLIEQLEEATKEVNDQLQQRREELLSGREAELAAIEERHTREVDELMSQAKQLQEQLQGLIGEAAPHEISFLGQPLALEDQAVRQDHLNDLRDKAAAEVQSLGERAEADKQDVTYRYDAELELRQHEAQESIDKLTGQQETELVKVQHETDASRKEIETIKPMVLLGESQYRDLLDRFGQWRFFKAGMGAEAVREALVALDLDVLRDTLRSEIRTAPAAGQRRKKANKRLRVVEAFRRSGNRAEWMIFTVLPVLPPDLRPMVQLDGGRFATSDLNDLYRRVINRNNRLRRLLELGAPEIIIRNEKRMLQEAVDSLIDNGRRGRAVSGSGNHKLKSLSDMLKGKQGRFRQNLLGKRVDYSGRSVIIVGPNLHLHQCGLPKRMALELFKPFVMRRLVEKGFAHNIKSAKRIVERVRPEVWDALEEVIQDHPVLLNRAPTLHRLGIQAFEPVLVDGSAIRIHPLVCAAFGADFDGDQMAVHVPLSAAAQEEARTLMLSVYNLLSPSSGEPIVAPTLDMVLGCYYMTVEKPGAKGEGKVFGNLEEARLAHDLDVINLQAKITVRMPAPDATDGETNMVNTTVGRILFNDILPVEMRFQDLPNNLSTNGTMDRKALRGIVGECYRRYGTAKTAQLVDDIKRLGFDFATQSGITIAIGDIAIPPTRDALLADADKKIEGIARDYRRGLITEDERYQQAIDVWTRTRDDVTNAVKEAMDKFGSIYMMTTSGAKGNIQQLTQMAGMRGLMAAPSGRIIDLPIRSSFREGLSVLEYFISTHGARKGLADTAIRTADSGYLTRRLIDVAQDVIINELDCGESVGTLYETRGEGGVVIPLRDRILGRYTAEQVINPQTGEIILEADEMVDESNIKEIEAAGITELHAHSPLSCQCRRGVCRKCYGRSLARGRPVDIGEAVGIIAAQSIGEPGTQLTMRTFHTGGVAGTDITSGLPRVEELFEARVPKGQAVIAEIDGEVTVERGEDSRHIKVTSREVYRDEDYLLPEGAEVLVEDGEQVDLGTPLARVGEEEIPSRMAGRALLEDGRVIVEYVEHDEREYVVSPSARLPVGLENGSRVMAGDLLTVGAANPQDILRIKGIEAVQKYMVDEVQLVYRSQGVAINDKHIEVIVRQMLRKVRVDNPGDSDLLPGDLVDRFTYEDANMQTLAEGGEPATAQTVLLGVTKASLNTESFLAAASFQETTRVLTEAAIQGNVDKLAGLKENVIIGKLIPAGSGTRSSSPEPIKPADPFAVLDMPSGSATGDDHEGQVDPFGALDIPSGD
ncbi:MAG: DNA-directed RNA polymerase subunit beta' [Chloroflexota bacterium]